MAAASLREITIPRFALRRDEAAASLSISPSTFDTWVREGKMPKPLKVGGITMWDVESLRSAWLTLADIVETLPDNDNPYEGLVL